MMIHKYSSLMYTYLVLIGIIVFMFQIRGYFVD